ncbi:MAG: hypothetical protein WD623_01240 [Marinobacter sp.]|uniref:hypothetical protein n=1 Tax=Marinobacter sp. TaxID=50741 RepID=UPI0034A0A00D
MHVDQLFDQTLNHMEKTVEALATQVPQPKKVSYKDGFIFRHVEKTAQQAIVQKLARLVSSLHATRLLWSHGFVQEQGAMQRILDELLEDITFLAFGIIFEDWTGLHDSYLEAFFEEEFDSGSAMTSSQRRPMIPRKKIRSWIASVEGVQDPSTGREATRTLSKAYSGYVHAASPHIMEMFGGNPPGFHMKGMRGTPRQAEHRADLWNYFYRGVLTFAFAVKALGNDEMFNSIRNFASGFLQSSGDDFLSKEWGDI